MKIDDIAVKIIELDLAADNIIMLAGEPAIGKTALTKLLAQRMNSKLFMIACNTLGDKTDFTGARLMPTPDKKSYEQMTFPHHVVREANAYALDNPRDIVLIDLDEINRASDSGITSTVMHFATERTLGNLKMAPNIRIIVTGNTKGNVTQMDDACLSRFSIYHVEPDAATWLAYMGDTLHPCIRAVLTKHPELIFQKSKPSAYMVDGAVDDNDDAAKASFDDLNDASEEMLQLTAPRTLTYLNAWLNKAGNTFMEELLRTDANIADREITMLQEVIEAKIGDTDFTTHLLAELAESFSSPTVANSGTGLVVPKPGCYADLKQAAGPTSTVAQLDTFIATLNDSEKSCSLLYALHESSDNTTLITQLAGQCNQLLPEHNAVLVKMSTANITGNTMLDVDNLNALRATSSTVANAVSALTSQFGL